MHRRMEQEAFIGGCHSILQFWSRQRNCVFMAKLSEIFLWMDTRIAAPKILMFFTGALFRGSSQAYWSRSDVNLGGQSFHVLVANAMSSISSSFREVGSPRSARKIVLKNIFSVAKSPWRNCWIPRHPLPKSRGNDWLEHIFHLTFWWTMGDRLTWDKERMLFRDPKGGVAGAPKP